MLGVIFALASCVSRGTADKIEGQRDSLRTVVSSKDSIIKAVFEDINAISENLAAIKTRENLLTVSESDIESRKRPVEEINNDIAAIDRLLQDNRKKIASLQHSAAQLRKANLRISGPLEDGHRGGVAPRTGGRADGPCRQPLEREDRT